MSITDKEQKDFVNVIIACGRNPQDFSINRIQEQGDIVEINVENRRLGHKNLYKKDGKTNWIIQFATDLRLGKM